MKKNPYLISACCRGNIILWELGNNKLWQQINILNEHEDCVNCLQINKDENLIISGSDD